MKRRILLSPALVAMILAGCNSQTAFHSRESWRSDQVRSHLAEDFRAGMDGFAVLEILNTYPTRFEDLYSGLWPSRDEWRRRIGGEYQPWMWSARELTGNSRDWSGPAVFVADLNPSGAPSALADSGTIWFELSSDLSLERWGHTLGADVQFFPAPAVPER